MKNTESKTDSRHVRVHLPADLYRDLRVRAAQEDSTMAAVIETACRAHLRPESRKKAST